MRFFAHFSDFGSISGGPGPSKKWLKIEKIDLGAHLERIGCSMVALGGFGERLRRVLGWFWVVLGRFGEGLGRVWGSRRPSPTV